MLTLASALCSTNHVTAPVEPITLEIALRLIAELRALVEQQAKQLTEQTKQLTEQAKRIAELEEQLRKNSSNSSKPPSSDPLNKKIYPPKQPSGRKRGGQPGHKKHERTLLPPEKARRVVEVKPSLCAHCGQKLSGEDLCPRRHQIIDLPVIEPVFDEYRLHTLACKNKACGHSSEATLPEGVSSIGFGPGVDAMVGQVAGMMRASKRTTADTMLGVFGVPMSLGAVIDAQQRCSKAIEAPCKEALEYTQKQSVRNVDETSWKEGTSGAYIWVCVTSMVVAFVIQTSRAASAAGVLLGAAKGILGSDRYSGYTWWPTALRQVCWAHLIRDFRAIAQRGESSAVLGNALLAEAERTFAWWSRLKSGDLQRRTFQVYMRSVRKRVDALLLEGTTDPNSKTAGTCRKMWKVREAFWTFVRVDGVEPTNNAAEQALRFGVLWRKMCYGTKSLAGSQFVARVLTVKATLGKQNRNVHAFLRAACEAHRNGQTAPSLLPGSAV
jgi:transposase